MIFIKAARGSVAYRTGESSRAPGVASSGSELGVNRRRIEIIRGRLDQAGV